jgi:hypothetical protein
MCAVQHGAAEPVEPGAGDAGTAAEGSRRLMEHCVVEPSCALPWMPWLDSSGQSSVPVPRPISVAALHSLDIAATNNELMAEVTPSPVPALGALSAYNGAC